VVTQKTQKSKTKSRKNKSTNSTLKAPRKDPKVVVDLPTLESNLDALKNLMNQLQEERKHSWISEKKRLSITERFHSVKKKHDLLRDQIERMKRG